MYRTKNKSEAKEWMETKWQEEWSDPNATTGRWTRQLIPDLRPWRNRRHGEINFHLAQFLTGHGVFGDCFLKYNLDISDACWFCGSPDSARHTVFICERWEAERTRAEAVIGLTITPENVCQVMLQTREGWDAVTGYIVEIMTQKEQFDGNGDDKEWLYPK